MLLHIALLCCQYTNGLLYLRDRTALRVGARLGTFQGLFNLGQLLRMVFQLGRQHFRVLRPGRGKLAQALNFFAGLGLALGPLQDLLLKGGHALLYPLAAIDHKTNFCLQAAYFGTGLVKQTLALVDLVGRCVMGLAHQLQVGLDVAQVG